MSIDALVTVLDLPAEARLEAVARGTFAALDAVGSSVDAERVPASIRSALDSATARTRERRLLDRLFSRWLDAAWRPVADWLASGPGFLAQAGTVAEILAVSPGAPACSGPDGQRFMFGLAGQPLRLVFAFDLRSFHRAPAGPEAVGRLLAEVSSRTGATRGAGGLPSTWSKGLDVDAALRSEALLAVSTSESLVSGFGWCPVTAESGDTRVVVAWRSPAATPGPSKQDCSPVALPIPTNLLQARWTGCSGSFVNGADDARRHYEKHVLTQQEWSTSELPEVATYVSRATSTLDATQDHMLEFWQPSNRSVVKYDTTQDTLAIGDLRDGDLRTCFRPGGADYVVRKIETGAWIPPPVLGSIAWDAVSAGDEELAQVLTSFERRVDEAYAAATAAVGHEERLIAAIAAVEEADIAAFTAHKLASDSRDGTLEVRLDALDLALAEAHAALDVALESLPRGAPDRAVHLATTRLLEALPAAVEAGEDLDDALLVRRRLARVFVACQTNGPLAGLVPLGTFRVAELAGLDALVELVRGARSDSDDDSTVSHAGPASPKQGSRPRRRRRRRPPRP